MSKPRIRVSAKGYTRTINGTSVKLPKQAAEFKNSVYEATGNGSRSSTWKNAGLISPVSLMGKSLDTLRNRVRYQVRNDPIASRVVDFTVGKIVGSGIKPVLKSGLEDEDFTKLYKAFFEKCDADGDADFYGLQEITAREVVTGGDCLSRNRKRDPERDKDLPIPMQVQILPGEMMPSFDSTEESQSGLIKNGIGRVEKYKIYKKHPGDVLRGTVKKLEFSYVDAEEINHIFWKREAGQIRGEPWLTRGLVTLHDLDLYQDAELVRKKMAAMPVFFIQTPNDNSQTEGPTGYSDGEDGLEAGTPVDAEGNEWIEEDPVELMPELGPGAVIPVPRGYEVKTSLPADVGGQYDVFVRKQLQRVCAAVNAPYELITGDTPNGSNERMMRVRIYDFYTQVKIWRRMMIRQFCQPTWAAFVNAAFDSGQWTPKNGLTVDDYINGVEWVGDPIPLVNPEQENRADMIAIRGGWKTLSQVIIERGGDPEMMLPNRSQELKIMDDLGIVTDSDPRKVSSAGILQDFEEVEDKTETE